MSKTHHHQPSPQSRHRVFWALRMAHDTTTKQARPCSWYSKKDRYRESWNGSNAFFLCIKIRWRWVVIPRRLFIRKKLFFLIVYRLYKSLTPPATCLGESSWPDSFPITQRIQMHPNATHPMHTNHRENEKEGPRRLQFHLLRYGFLPPAHFTLSANKNNDRRKQHKTTHVSNKHKKTALNKSSTYTFKKASRLSLEERLRLLQCDLRPNAFTMSASVEHCPWQKALLHLEHFGRPWVFLLMFGMFFVFFEKTCCMMLICCGFVFPKANAIFVGMTMSRLR